MEASRITGGDALFEGLPCQRGAEVSIELPGGRRWLRIPVSADALAPSTGGASLVRYAVVAR